MGSLPLNLARYEIEGPDRANQRLVVVAALYFAQGIPWGFATITLAALLAEQGVDANAIGQMLAADTDCPDGHGRNVGRPVSGWSCFT